MDLVKRFLKYVSYDTQSDENSETTPSTLKQLELQKYLVNELKSIGITNAFLDQYGIVYASIDANVENQPSIGLIAHVDTSPDCSGANIKPRIIEKYDGSDIELNPELTMKVSEFPCLKDNIGEDLIVTDGTTLLGADDKAGVAIIVETCYRIINDKNYKHGPIKIAFTPDEEVGRGTDNFDVKFFDCDFAYTLDGGDIRAIEYENFNAYSATVKIKGVSIHPGSAKDKMINSALLAMEFDGLLPKDELPSKTEKRECFHHLCGIQGDVENSVMYYILRSFDPVEIERQANDFKEAANKLNEKYNGEFVTVDIKESYRNMKEIIDQHPEVLKRVTDVYDKLNMPYVFEPIRGGTDGARLSFEGLPTPNLGDGGYNFHGKYEYVSITQMRRMVKILLELLKA